MKRVILFCLMLAVAIGAQAQHSHEKMRGMHDYGDSLLISATLISGEWTCALGSTTCTGADPGSDPPDAQTELDDGDIVELQTSAGWERFEVSGEPSAADSFERHGYYGTGDNRTQDPLRAVASSAIYHANQGITSAVVRVVDVNGGQSPLQLSTTDVASTTIALTAGADVTSVSNGRLRIGAAAGNLDYTKFSAAATTNDLTLFILPAKAQLMSLYMVVVTPAAFGDTYTLSVGSSSPYDQIIKDSDGKAVADTLYGDSDLEIGPDLPDAEHMARRLYSYTSTQTITVRADGNATNLDQASAGEWRFILVYTVLP